MKAHPYAEIFPMFEPGPLKELSIDIKVNGQQEEIDTIRHEGEDKILDGRNRYQACLMAGVEPQFKEYLGDDPLGYVISKNKIRRNLSPGELGEVGAKIATMMKGDNRHTILDTPNGVSRKISQAEAAEMTGASLRSVQRAVAKSKPARAPEPTSWTIDEVRADDALLDAFRAISLVYGKDDTVAIRTKIGLKRKDVLVLSRLKKQQMLDIKELVMGSHWAPQKALDFLSKMPTIDSTNEEMQNWCLAQPEKKIVADIGGFRHTCEKISK